MFAACPLFVPNVTWIIVRGALPVLLANTGGGQTLRIGSLRQPQKTTLSNFDKGWLQKPLALQCGSSMESRRS
jgi:hypothetical protein